jgi:hypothetical protein
VSYPLKVRWAEFSGTTDWKPCHEAAVQGEVLVIKLGADRRDLIPLHVIRGTIEVRPNDEEQV